MVVWDSVVDIVPAVGRVPLHPPDAVHIWAPFAVHWSVTVSPAATLLEDSWKFNDGLGVAGADEELLLVGALVVGALVEDAVALAPPLTMSSPLQPTSTLTMASPRIQAGRRAMIARSRLGRPRSPVES